LSAMNQGKAKKIARSGARTAGGLIVLILKIIGTLFLIGITTGLIFACIFTIYVKTNLTTGLDLSLDDFKMNLSSKIYYKDPNTGEDKELVTIQSSELRTWVDYADIPEDMEQALVAIEDKRFYVHDGVDWYRTVAAFGNMFLSMKDNFGGSTITQQLIKNLTQEDEVTVQRKLLEIFRAIEFEKEYEKDEIIEWYLNVVYFGHTRYGIGEAANYYFGKDVKDLTLAECASIVAITNNPSQFSPYLNEEENKGRQEKILKEMFAQGYISAEELEEAVNQKLVFQKGASNEESTVTYTWFEDAVIEDAIAAIMELKDCTYKAAEDLLFRNGLKIYSTLNPEIQAKVDSIYTDLSVIPEVSGSSQQIQSAIVITDPDTGDIVAMSGGVGEKDGNRIFNRATQSRRPPGSSIKPLSVYAPAIEYGFITPLTRFDDSADVKLDGTNWMPKNDDLKYSGVVDVRTAVRRSINTVAAQIIDMMKPALSYDFMTKTLGFNLDPYDEDYAPLALGQITYGVSVREMASAYTMFINDGIRTEARTFTRISDNEDNVIIDNPTVQITAISDTTAYWVTSMLQDAAKSGTGYESYLGFMPNAGKTGTSTDKKDRWFAGYTPYYVGIVWTGYDTPAKMSVKGNPAAQLWKKVMTLVHENMEPIEFSKPTSTYLAPIPGVNEEVTYVMRGVTMDGQVLYEESGKKREGKEVTATAKEFAEYTIVGESVKTLVVTDDPEKNVIEFFYMPINAEPSTEPSTDPTTDPWAEPSTDPSTEPSTEPSTDPSTEPSTEPSTDPTTNPFDPFASPPDWG
jgi:penicillin-binding protein 1A